MLLRNKTRRVRGLAAPCQGGVCPHLAPAANGQGGEGLGAPDVAAGVGQMTCGGAAMVRRRMRSGKGPWFT